MLSHCCAFCLDRYLWAEAGAQPELEAAFEVGGYGYPALVAVKQKQDATVIVPFKSAYEPEHLRFVPRAEAVKRESWGLNREERNHLEVLACRLSGEFLAWP